MLPLEGGFGICRLPNNDRLYWVYIPHYASVEKISALYSTAKSDALE
jgi:hypothetical protein